MLVALLCIGFIAITFYHGQCNWRRFSAVGIIRSKEVFKSIEEQHLSGQLAGLDKFITDFFDGTPVTQHILKFGENGLIIKIGDEKNLVEVDPTEFLNNPPEALERARMEWANLND